MRRIQHKMMCVKEKVEVRGDYHSISGTSLSIEFERCNKAKDDKCQTKETIDDWLARKFLVTYFNTEKFDKSRVSKDFD